MRNENRNVRKTVPERMLYSLSIIFWSDYMPSGKLYSGSRKFGRVICIKYDFQSYCVIKKYAQFVRRIYILYGGNNILANSPGMLY